MFKKENLKDFYITSDTWFGRPQILGIANRSAFKNIDQMNAEFIKRWNKTVSNGDLVFHLGNFAWDPHTAKKVLKKLNGTIYFIIGNADDALLDVIDSFENKAEILDGQIIELPQFDSVISHYPLLEWNGRESGTIHFHGHTVFSHPTDLRISNRINVCTDFWNYSPIKFSTIKDFINGKK